MVTHIKQKELYKAVKNKNKVVTSGNGLYEMNGEYVFRGGYSK